MDDERIVKLFFERSETAIVQLSLKYGQLCMRIANNILFNHEDAEECVNDSYLAVWNAIPPKNPNSLPAFLLRIVRNISINRYTYNHAEKRRSNYQECLDELEREVVGKNFTEEQYDNILLSRYINEYIDSLNEKNRLIFVRRYWYMDSYAEIAKAVGLRESAIRTRLSRLRAELKMYLRERGVNV